MPMEVEYELGLTQPVIDGLTARGHSVRGTDSHAVVNGISRGNDGRIYANADFRKAGGIAGF